MTNPNPNACNCITYKASEVGLATCGPCMSGEHNKCSAHQHGVLTDRCPRVPHCYILTCHTQPRYRAEAWPIGTRVQVCRDHIATAADYFTTAHSGETGYGAAWRGMARSG